MNLCLRQLGISARASVRKALCNISDLLVIRLELLQYHQFVLSQCLLVVCGFCQILSGCRKSWICPSRLTMSWQDKLHHQQESCQQHRKHVQLTRWPKSATTILYTTIYRSCASSTTIQYTRSWPEEWQHGRVHVVRPRHLFRHGL